MNLPIQVGILNEASDSENRVAMVPEDAKKLLSRNVGILVQTGAGVRCGYSDLEYQSAGCNILRDRGEILSHANVIVMLGRPDPQDLDIIPPDSILVGQIFPLRFREIVDKLVQRRIRTYSLELLPRTTRAQSMDVLSSQSAVTGYRAAIVGAYHSPRLMPMLTTAAGTVKPANVLVIGAGVAGLMAVATAKRLGASVSAYDVRRAAGDDVRSLGAKFIEVGLNAEGAGGYARELTEEEKKKEKDMLESAIISSDVVITTAGVPGKKAPLVISADAVKKMKAGSIIVDAMADSGGNCELTQRGNIVNYNGVKIIGLVNPPSDAPINASQMFSRNVLSFLSIMIDKDGKLADPSGDDLLSACLVCTDGRLTYAPLLKEGDKK